jgi:hypothetical protein
MGNLISYLSFIALILVVILLIWSLILTRRERAKKVTAKSRLARLRGKIEALPEKTDEDRSKKESLYRELTLEYLDSILGGVEKLRAGPSDRKEARKKKTKKKK